SPRGEAPRLRAKRRWFYGASERSERATRTERAGAAARERACRGVRGAEPLGKFRTAPLNHQLTHRSHLDAAFARRRDLGGDLYGLVEIAGVDQVEAGELFLGFRERAIRHRD